MLNCKANGRSYLAKLEEIYFYRERSLNNQQTQIAWDHYENLVSTFGGDIKKASNKILASYLNVSPECLSRLKKKHVAMI